MLHALLGLCLAASHPAPTIDVYRDFWGVPSIVADNYPDAMYALGYMQVTDDGERMALNYKISRGRAAEVLGSGQLLVDGFLRGLEIEDRADQAKLSPESEQIIQAFLAGANRALAERRDHYPSWIQPFTRTDVLSMAQFVNCAFPLLDLSSQIMPGVGSNQFAIGPGKSATGHPILSMDPHLDWNGADGGIVWYECGIYAGGLQFRGISIPGLPACVMGHNDRFGWSITNNDPQLYTRYIVKTDPQDPTKYSYHGEMRTFRTKQVTLKYLANGEIKESKQTLKLTDWGPMIPLHNEAALIEPLGNFNAIEQSEAMMRSHNGAEFRSALDEHGLSMWNFVYAGSDGEIGYQYNAALHRRDPSIDWTKPVDGSDPKTRLGDYWPQLDLPHIERPASGLLVNCNSDPKLVPVTAEMPGSWPAYVTSYGLTSRYRMLSDLLTADPKIDPDEAKSYATDTRVPFAKATVAAMAAEAGLRDDPLVRVLSAWNLRADVDSRGTAAFAYWLAQPNMANLAIKVAHGQPWTNQETAAVASAVTQAATQMTTDGLALDVRWGQVLRMRRGDKEIGVEGFSGMTSNRAVAVNPSGPSSTLRQMKPLVVAGRGSSWRMIVSFEPGHVRSWSILPYGNSHDPSSPYYSNQMSLYATGRYKETTFGAAAAIKASVQRISLSRE